MTDAERERITRCLDEHGGVCREVMCDESLDVLIDSIVRQRAARAWDEGYDARGVDIANEGLTYRSLTQNPYRTRVLPPEGDHAKLEERQEMEG